MVYKETMVNPIDHVITFLGAFFGIAVIGLISNWHKLHVSDYYFFIGSFGASAVLLYGLANSPLAQPRNLFGGHILSAFIGVSCCKLLGAYCPMWLAAALAVSTAIVVMQVTKTLHPPGGATALIATIGSEKVKALGYWYILSPVFLGILTMFIIALFINNLHKDKAYPQKWF